MTPSSIEWLLAPGVFLLPSGRRVLVGEVEETWVTVECHAGVRLVVDFDEPEGGVYLSLHRARTPLDGPPATRPYRCAATVLFNGTPATFEIRDIPSTRHQRDCEHCPLDERSGFAVDVPADLLTAYVDFLSGLPVDTRHWWIPPIGARLWRGRISDDGRALIELLAEDDLLWESATEVVDRVDLGLLR